MDIRFPDLNDTNAAAYYRQVQDMRQVADFHERRLIRYLRHEATGCGCRRDGKPGHTWRHVAALVAANLGTRQGAQAKWSRLTDDNRRKPGGAVQGGRRRSVSN